METDKADAAGEGDDRGLDVDAGIDELEEVLKKSRWDPEPDWITFTQFIEEAHNRKKLLAHGYRLTGDRDDTADLVQEAVAYVLPFVGDSRMPTGAFVNAIKRKMTQLNIDALRRRGTARGVGNYGDDFTMPDGTTIDVIDLRHSLPDSILSPGGLGLMREGLDEIADAIGRLTPLQQLIVLLTLGLHHTRYGVHMSQTEIASYLGIPVHLVKSRWRQALTSLRADLQQYWNDWNNS